MAAASAEVKAVSKMLAVCPGGGFGVNTTVMDLANDSKTVIPFTGLNAEMRAVVAHINTLGAGTKVLHVCEMPMGKKAAQTYCAGLSARIPDAYVSAVVDCRVCALEKIAVLKAQQTAAAPSSSSSSSSSV